MTGLKFLLSVFLLLLSSPTSVSAVAGTGLSLIPQPGSSSSATKSVGDIFPVDLMVNPTNGNAVTIIKAQINYDPTKLEPVAGNLFTTAPDFPSILSGPAVGNGTVSILISIGSDVTKAVTVAKKAGSFNFKAIATTGSTPTTISFTNQTQVYSSGANDQAAENVLSTPQPATITITEGGGEEPTGTRISFDLMLHGMGNSGDSINPTSSNFSNKNPNHPQRNLIVSVFNADNEQVANPTGTITYNGESGSFKGTVGLPSTLATGAYTVKIKSDRYLRKKFLGTVNLVKDQDNILPQIALVAGDTDGNNALNIIDYNALLDCGYGSVNPLPITNLDSEYNSTECKTHEPRINIDLDDNGIVNSFDYNLFLRELHIQNGD